MQIKIDTRENDDVVIAFVKLGKRLEKQNKDNFEIKREQLITGDIVIGNVCFERKEGLDFVASVCDSRMITQAQTMVLNFEHRFVIIVGNLWESMIESQSEMNRRAVIGMINSLYVRYQIPVFFANNVDDFAYYCYNIVSKLNDGKRFNPEEHKVVKYKLSDEDVFLNVLSCSGIGPERAKVIAKRFNHSLFELCNSDLDTLLDIKDIGKGTIEKLKRFIKKGKKTHKKRI